MNPCITCIHFHSTTGPSGWLELCTRLPDRSPSIAFERDAMGACGTEGRYWREK